MSHRNVPLKLVPAGLVLDRHEIGVAGITVHAHSASPTSNCPTCGLASSSVHSRYERSLGNLPAHGRRLGIRLSARRFRCRNTACERRVLPPHLADPVDAEVRLEHASDLDLQRRIALGPRRQLGGSGLAGGVEVIGRRGDRQYPADRLDPVNFPMIVDEGDHGRDRRSSSAMAKYALALRRISLA